MDFGEWFSVLSAVVVAGTSILALYPAEPEPIFFPDPAPDIIYIQARAVFTDAGQVYVLDLDKKVHRLNSSVVVYHSKKELS